ncbi:MULTISPECIES: carbon starvation CstA family protein [unclassified Streptomyces]|uniref:carbon starvation CstA family protein n=1 Tax=unclassified Streptomyces TaxID=2593676 RepID=UPI0009A0B818|nr:MULTISPECIES: carbon starvation CstA family protein [unclassified Streptomyces]MBT2376453.1 carbon starvation protein A [Streptomyces sp. ISL-111]MBT2427032.1 carbon starvation protein A [Streptomyces sp. ISL-112]MBT2460546.1 carbon starvation protein A [Streptomyces sp. ISL-63]
MPESPTPAPPVPQAPGRRTLSPKSIAVWSLVGLVGAIGWATLALSRGEEVSAAWMLAAALGSYAIAYRFYSRFIANRVLKADKNRATPAERLDNGVDFHPTDRRVLFGHHFAAIAGAGPLVGPVLAAQMGYLPGTIWLVVGVIFAGAVQDMVTLFFSTRRNGRSLGQMARDEIGPVGGIAALVAVFMIMIILLAVLALVIVNALAHSPWGVFSIGMTIPIALFMGVYLRILRPGKVSEVSLIGVALLLLAIVSGGWVAESSWADFFTLEPGTLVIWMIVYGFLASVLPVWLLLAPRDYLSTFMKIGTIGLLALGVIVALPTLKMPAITDFATNGQGPVFAGSMFPFVFITIACGALSGFHSLVSSGTTPKMVQKETQIRMIGYGAMLVESFVAIMAMIAACIIDPGLYFAINAPAGVIGDSVQAASQAVANFGFTISPEALAQAAKDVEETSLLSRTGGAPTFALGMAEIFSAVIGGTAMKAFWYHFAIMFEALFILTTVDAGTRVGRFMLQDMLGNAYKPFREVSWKPGVWFASAVVVGGWGYFLWVGVHDPLGGINQLFPLFGIANQLLAAVALAVCTTLLVKSGRLRWAWVTAVPLAWDVAVTLTASWQKIFSPDVKIGFFAQRDKYQAGIDAGEVLPPAKNMDDMQTVVTNSTVDGVLCALFALLIIVVLVDAGRVCFNAIRDPESVKLHETPYVESKLVAPASLIATKEEKAELAAAGVGPEGGIRKEAAGTGSRT